MHALITYLKNVRLEFSHVVWPPTHRAIAHTLIVIAISIATGLIIGIFDYIFTTGVSRLVGF